jgi:hypothetical protein
MTGKSCAVVLVGSATAGRKWIDYEIVKAWNDGKGVVGIHIHNLKDASSNQSTKGTNPFLRIRLKDGTQLSSIVKTYDPPYTKSNYVYDDIVANIAELVEDAISTRSQY